MIKNHRNILITGATSGIGYALFRQLYESGHNLIIVSRNKAKLEQIRRHHPATTTYAVDLSLKREVETLCTELLRDFNEIDILINNAGVQYTPTVLDDDFSFDSIEYETRINFLSPVWLTTLLLPVLIQNDSRSVIVNISSGLVFAPKTNSAIYCANKAALHSYSQSLRYQLESTRVAVQEAILPLVDTPMTTGRGTNKLSADKAASEIIQGIKKGKDEIYVGKTRFLPLLMRLSPSFVKNMLRRY